MLFVFNLVNPVKKFWDRLRVAAGTMIKADNLDYDNDNDNRAKNIP
ncbi:hypothetical protein [uncultured Thiodictyon sp.]|jgi:hypothetical protein|nr:hypothetical protein [uncultured Thiodictyon sp.]